MMRLTRYNTVVATAIAAFALAPLYAAEPGKCLQGVAADALERANANVTMRLAEAENGFVLEAINLRPAPSELIMEPIIAPARDSRSLVLPPLSTVPVLELDAAGKTAARDRLSATWSFRSFMGVSGEISPDTAYLYRLPFRAGKSYSLSQGFHGKQSHHSETSRYALDFQLEVGEPVHAARGGLVVRAVDWFCRSGGEELIDQVNMIVVLHDDGTMANYVHLAHEGVLVSEGDRVERGQHIGYVGMTGFTRGPHLHFVVRRERDIAIPVRFEAYEDADLSRRGRFKVP